MTNNFENAFSDVNVNTNTGTGNNTTYESNIDWTAYANKIIDVMEGEGKHVLIGYVGQICDLGNQVLDEQVIVWDDKAKKDHEWRFKPRKDKDGKEIGEGQADPSAKIEQRTRKGKSVECLVYQQAPVRQAAISVDFPENLFPYGDFYDGAESAPFRAIIGENGFITDKRQKLAGTFNIVGKPFNLKHINVNRQKEGAKPHYALAKNGMLYNLADYTGCLDAEGNFHAGELGKLIGKPLSFEVEVVKESWMKDGVEQVKAKVNITPSGALSKRDQKAWDEELKDVMKDEYLGFVLLDSDKNDEETLKKLNSKLLNTIKMSPDFTGSKLEAALNKIGKLGDNSSQSSSEKSSGESGTNTTENDKTSEKASSKPVENVSTPTSDIPEMDVDFSDDIPF